MKFIKSSLTYGTPFGIGMGLFWGFQYGLWYGVFGGMIAGLLFGISMAFLTTKLSNRFNKAEVAAREEIGDDEIIFSSGANTVDGFFPKLGWLTLTTTHLIFTQELKRNSKVQKIEIALTSIKEVKAAKHRLNSNAILVVYDGKSQKFLMDGLDARTTVKNTIWIEKIQNAIYELKEDIQRY